MMLNTTAANLKWVAAPERHANSEIIVAVRRLPYSGRHVADAWGVGPSDPKGPDTDRGKHHLIAYTKSGRGTRFEALQDLLVQSEDMMSARDRLNDALAKEKAAAEGIPMVENGPREEDAQMAEQEPRGAVAPREEGRVTEEAPR